MDEDYAYFHQRAERELEWANMATHARAVAAHHQLAEAYRQRASSPATNHATKHDAS